MNFKESQLIGHPASSAVSLSFGAVRPARGLASFRSLHATKSGVLIVGGGPAGLAMSLMLSKRGWKDITVLEKLPAIDFDDPTKSYVYSIDGRGRKFTDLLGLTDHVRQAGVEMSNLQIVRVPVSGPAKKSGLQIKDKEKQTHWMPRKSFLTLLNEGIKASEPGSIQVLTNSSCSEIIKTEQGTMQVVADVDGVRTTFEPSLLVGADGLGSAVRQTLDSWDASGKFAMHKLDSPAAGLRYKVMLLPPNPVASKDGELVLPNSSMAVLEGKNLRMGLLPIKDSSMGRTGNFILKPDHPFWSIDTAEKLYENLEANFPQLPIRQLISEEQAQKFASGSGGFFPKPQYCGAMHMLLPGSEAEAASEHSTDASPTSDTSRPSQAVLLVGDAVHSFPPDLGQGVNSALEDVAVLNGVMEECGDALDVALPMYEKVRLPDVQALVKIMQFGYPYQYNQDPVAKAIWTANFMVRLALNKVVPFLVAPPAFMMVQDYSMSYSEVLARAEGSTKILRIIAFALVMAVVAFLLKP